MRLVRIGRMGGFLEYTLLLVALLLLQIFLFNNLTMSMYITPLIYVAFFVLLPAGSNSGLMLGLGFVVGIVVDLFMGTAGINTIASLATCFVRPAIINLTLGKESSRESNVPLPLEQGTARWLRYAAFLILIHCAVFFLSESMNFHYMGFTLLRILCSAFTTLVAVWIIASLYAVKGYRRN